MPYSLRDACRPLHGAREGCFRSPLADGMFYRPDRILPPTGVIIPTVFATEGWSPHPVRGYKVSGQWASAAILLPWRCQEVPAAWDEVSLSKNLINPTMSELPAGLAPSGRDARSSHMIIYDRASGLWFEFSEKREFRPSSRFADSVTFQRLPDRGEDHVSMGTIASREMFSGWLAECRPLFDGNFCICRETRTEFTASSDFIAGDWKNLCNDSYKGSFAQEDRIFSKDVQQIRQWFRPWSVEEVQNNSIGEIIIVGSNQLPQVRPHCKS